jgi:uncharacterized protein (DUF433 family)
MASEHRRKAAPRSGQVRRAQAQDRIVIDPTIMLGKPVIRGSRITVELILRKLGLGMRPEDVIADHPGLTIEDIHAAQAFAADYLADEELVFDKLGVG